jgi:hypothetical protein
MPAHKKDITMQKTPEAKHEPPTLENGGLGEGLPEAVTAPSGAKVTFGSPEGITAAGVGGGDHCMTH